MTNFDTTTILILLVEAVTIIIAIGVTWGMTRVRLKNVEDAVKELKGIIEKHEEHSVDFREDTVQRIAYLESKLNGHEDRIKPKTRR